jgi:hypothetical protein
MLFILTDRPVPQRKSTFDVMEITLRNAKRIRLEVEKTFRNANRTRLDQGNKIEPPPESQVESSRSKKTKPSVEYVQLASQHFHSDSLQTYKPMMALTFPGGNIAEQTQYRDRALELLDEKLATLDPPRTWKDLEGIKLVEGQFGPEIAIHYQPKFAEFLKHTLGFCLDKLKDYTTERDELKRCNPEFLQAADRIGDELASLWQEQTCNVPLNSQESIPEVSIFNLSASHENYVDTVKTLMQHNFLIGEYHGCDAPRNFILQNMQRLRQEGFTLCYLEALPKELQCQLDTYLDGPTDAKMPLELALYASAMNVTKIIVAAKEEGIRVVGIDSGFARRDGHNPLSPFNHFATYEIELNSGKFFGLVGGGHAGNAKDTVGIAQMANDCRSVFIMGNKYQEEFTLISRHYRDKLESQHSYAAYVNYVECDLYIGVKNAYKMSIDMDGNTQRFVSLDKSPHDKPLFLASPKALMHAIDKKDGDEIERLLKIDKRLVNRIDEQGKTPFIHAIVNNNNNKILSLLFFYADRNQPDSQGKTPLMYAVETGDVALMKSIHRIASQSSIDNAGKTALMLACEMGNEKMVMHLIAGCSNDNYVRSENNLSEKDTAQYHPNRVARTTLLSQDERGMTGLHYAVQSGNLEVVKMLLAHGADPSVKDKEGNTPISIAKEEDEEMKRWLNGDKKEEPGYWFEYDWDFNIKKKHH